MVERPGGVIHRRSQYSPRHSQLEISGEGGGLAVQECGVDAAGFVQEVVLETVNNATGSRWDAAYAEWPATRSQVCLADIDLKAAHPAGHEIVNRRS
jgi:hypothetical protein